MLKWFADRLARTGDEVRKDERGFTLIELLVVVIIIGIIAAIAIPTFLNQRGGAQDAAAESDLRNLAGAAQAYYADNEGTYTGMDVETLSSDYGFNSSDSVSNTSVTVGSDGDTFTATADSASGNSFTYTSDSGTVSQDDS